MAVAARREHVGWGQLRRSHQAFRRHGGRRWPDVARPGRRAPRAARLVRVRQDDGSAARGRVGGGERRHRHHRRARRERRRPQGPRRRHGLPELRALPALDGGQEHRVPAPSARRGQGGAGDQGEKGGRDPRARHPARPQAIPALGWAAPAGRAGPRHRARTTRVPHGRTAVEPRRRAPGPDAGRHRGVAGAPVHHHHLRHPRPGRGHDDGTSHRSHERREAATGRRARGPLRRAPPTHSSPTFSGAPA